MHGSLDLEQQRAVDERVRDHVDEILESSEFTGSERRRDLLRYLVEESLAGRAGELRAQTIATEVLGRSADFDPQVDPIVRVEVGRLRANLDRFYRHHPDSPVVLEIPKGQHGVRATTWQQPSAAKVAVLPVDLTVADDELTVAFSQLDRRIGAAIASQTKLPVIAEIGRGEQHTEPANVAATLGATFLLSGSIRAVRSQVRAHFTLYDDVVGAGVWSEEFDLDAEQMRAFEIEDWLVRRVCGRVSDGFGVINRQLHEHPHAARNASSSDAAKLSATYRSPTAESLREIIDRGDELGAGSSRALAGLSDAAFTGWWLGLDDSMGGVDAASELAQRSVALDPQSPEAHMALAYSLFGQRDLAGFEAAIQRAQDLSGMFPQTLAASGLMITLAGDLVRGSELCELAVELNPYLPDWWRVVPALEAITTGRYERAWVEGLGIGRAGAYVGPMLRIAATGLSGAEARPGDLEDLLEWQPTFIGRGRELTTRFFLDDGLRTEVEKGLVAAGLDLR